MKIDRQQFEDRIHEIPQPIRNIAYDNAAIHRIMELYARGDIITLQEALCQMIVHLNTDWSRVKKDYIDMIALQAQPMFVPQR